MTKLSLCVIARDEGAYLERCLQSVAAIVDEIVLVDTGSTDNTRAIAAQFGARIFNFDWVDDFSQARNYALAQAGGNWILVLDADETIAARDHLRLRELVTRAQADGYSLIQRSYASYSDPPFEYRLQDDYAESQAFNGWVPSPLVRLFRNDIQYRFRYRVHELIEPSILEHQGRIAATGIPIHHFMHQKEEAFNQAKEDRYLALALRQIAETPTDPKPYREAAQAYMKKNDYAHAESCLRKGIELDPKDASRYLCLGGLYLATSHFSACEAVLQQGLAVDPANVAMMSNLACVYINKQAFRQAEGVLRRALAITPNLIQLHNNLGAVLLADGRIAEAQTAFLASLRLDSNNLFALTKLSRIYLQTKEFDQARPLLIRAYEIKPADAEIRSLLQTAGLT